MMKEKKDIKDNKDNKEQVFENIESPGGEFCCGDEDCGGGLKGETGTSELEILQTKLNDKSRQCEEYLNMLQRVTAEFDNYRKRTTREKELLYNEAVGDVVVTFLPVVDNLDRALSACCKDAESQSLKDGVNMVLRQLKEILSKLGVEEIQSIGEEFDPVLHNAVMHIDDDSCGCNIVVEEFQKGYKYKEKIIRHSMVKVAN